MLKISYADCLGLSPAVSAQFTLEMRVAAQNREKFTKTPYFRGSRSFKVIDVDIFKKLVANACLCLFATIFNVGGGNTGRITPFKGGCPCFAPSFVGTPFTQGHEILETLSYHMVKTRSLYLTWSWNGTGT